MACQVFNFGNGAVGIVCGPRRSRLPPCACGGAPERQCDFPLGGRGRGAVCNRSLCTSCSKAWMLTAPVQPAPAYRKKHGDLDLCRVHAELVARGRGMGMLGLLVALRARGGPFYVRLDAATLEQLPALLDEGHQQAEAYHGRHHSGGADVERVVRLGAAMAHLAVSLRAAGDPVAVFEAEKLALAALPNWPSPNPRRNP